DPARRLLYRLQNDVLLETRRHSVGQCGPRRVQRVEVLARIGVLPSDDLLHALGLDEAERGGELAHAEVEAVDLVFELAVVAELAGELDQSRIRGDEHAPLAG